MKSFAISDVEYLMMGLSDSPIPRLSHNNTLYLSPCVWPKSFVCRCHDVLRAPRPMINCIHGQIGSRHFVNRPMASTSDHGGILSLEVRGNYISMVVTTSKDPTSSRLAALELPPTARLTKPTSGDLGHGPKPAESDKAECAKLHHSHSQSSSVAHCRGLHRQC